MTQAASLGLLEQQTHNGLDCLNGAKLLGCQGRTNPLRLSWRIHTNAISYQLHQGCIRGRHKRGCGYVLIKDKESCQVESQQPLQGSCPRC